MDAYKTFFIEGQFPVLTGNNRTFKWNKLCKYIDDYKLKNNSLPIEYFNSDLVLDKLFGQLIEIKPDSSNENWPYYLQRNQYGSSLFEANANFNFDTLAKLIFENLNFWFCYTELPEGVKVKNEMEAQTFYSLNGITVSETLDFKRNKNRFTYVITYENTCKDIFKLNSNGDVVTNDKFPGYKKSQVKN